jgi:uncharacterized protein (TIGR00730 family)
MKKNEVKKTVKKKAVSVKKPAQKKNKSYLSSYSTGDTKLDQKVRDLVASEKIKDADLVEEMIFTAFKLAKESDNRGDMKLLKTTMKELRYAFKVFRPYRKERKVAVFGSARTPRTSPDYKQAKEFSRLIAKEDWMVITGASAGIMHAGNEGAGRKNSFGVNISLPFEQSANPVINGDDKLVNFKYFFTRKLIFVRESDATVLCPGGFGTHDEGFETLTLIQTGKTSPRPVICLDPPHSKYWESWRKWIHDHLAKNKLIDKEDINLIDFTHSPKEAVKIVTSFYHNYHSVRYIRDLLVMRIKRPIPQRALMDLNKRFKGILAKGEILQHENPFEEENSENYDQMQLTRLSMYFDRRSLAKMKQFIEAINQY